MDSPFGSAKEKEHLTFLMTETNKDHLVMFPWDEPLETWGKYGVRFKEVKSGLSRHVVRFIQSKKRQFAIKETSVESATREYKNYLELMKRNVQTLLPVGVVVRTEGSQIVQTKIGEQRQEQSTGFLVTELMEKVIPDSFLFRRGFTKANRVRIWDAVIRLFVDLHCHGVYWGDASLANMLIRFETEIVPELGFRTRLTAVLADAETVEIHPAISDSMRLADVDFFLESMLWTEADLTASGIVRDPVITESDHEYFLTTYNARYAVEQETISFELITHIDVDKLLGSFDAKGYGKLLLQHINEHKWYLSEQQGKEVPLIEAAEDWYTGVFRPSCRVFQKYDVLECFPDKSASSLYVEVMEHKYFMSQNKKQDVGLVSALEDYADKFATADPVRKRINSMVKELSLLLSMYAAPAHSLYL